jgi:Transcriptional activator TraM
MNEEPLGRGSHRGIDTQATEIKTDRSDDGMEAIIRAVAVKHGIALGYNDPILVLQTINGLLLDEFARKQDVLIHEFHVNMEATADLWGKNMESKASEILGSMENSHRHLIGELIEQQIENIAGEIAYKSGEIAIEQQLKASKHLRSLNSQLKTMRSMLYVNFAASIMALISAIVILWLSIK